MRNKSKIVILIMILMLMTGCRENKTTIKEDLLDINFDTQSNEVNLENYDTENPVIAMKIKNYGAIVIELFPTVAPNTVNNFISLVKNGFYDNNTFHRLVPGFVLQGGDPTGLGTGGPGYTIQGEFTKNGFENDLKHEKWIVSMARSISYDSAGSQFFIMLGNSESLDGLYASFGRIIDGKETIEKITKEEVVENETTGQLKNNLTIEKSVVDLQDKNYNEVKKITK